MYRILLLGLSALIFYPAFTQTGKLSMDSCYAMAKRNYPLLKQYALIEKSREYSLENAAKGTLPQLNLAGQGTYQSEVTRIPISLPNLEIPTLSKDQYKLYAEVAQPITDLFTVKYQKELIKSNAEVESQKIEVELFKIKERINQLFFGIILVDAQIQQTELLKKDIQLGIDKTNAAIANGTALKSSVNALKAELLKANQRIIELKAARKGYLDMLSLFIHQQLDDNVVLEKPAVLSVSSSINRPELRLYSAQQRTFEVQNKLIAARNLPRASLFLQGGYGKPALNVLNNAFDLYYIGGLRLNWNLSGYYTAKNERKILSINQDIIGLQQETFLFNTNLNLKQQNAELSKLQELIASDSEIIQLRESIKNTAKNQLDFGTVTSNDYITYLNAEDQAKQGLLLHQIQLLMAQYNYQTTSGN
ncbi:MAG TPA: TolC family protein [Haliscomenobacter sp.]|uniref:TolC family protein n=1 Tax=Haliscomenobacter sp. TaxID=2717303 RepID=UPI002CDC3FAF|nr:TolC family protein [Haliscomenobacter sp.]HOY18342.1 TolC family protein [Haliscomenobacter sp.]